MNEPNDQISEDLVDKILAEASRLHTDASKSYSFAELQQICKDAQIPPHIFRQAVKNVEAKRLHEQQKRRQLQEGHKYIQEQVKRGISVGIALLIPAIAVSSIFIFRSQFEPLLASVVSRFTKIIEQPEVIIREDFRNRVVGKTSIEVIQAVGEPYTTLFYWPKYGSNRMNYDDYVWYYRSIKPSTSGKVNPAMVFFKNGVVDKVKFAPFYYSNQKSNVRNKNILKETQKIP